MRSARLTPALFALVVWAQTLGSVRGQAAPPPPVKPVQDAKSATPPAQTPPAQPTLTADELTLKAANLTATPAAMLDFFRQRTATEVAPDKLAILIRQLNAPVPEDRNVAFGELVCLGPAAVAGLRQAANNLDDLEGAARARHCLQFLQGINSANVTKAAARWLSGHQPAGAAEALLSYLPFADDESVVAEVQIALTALAMPDGKPEPALLKALEDATPIRRAIAAETLCRAGGVTQHVRVKPLLQDPKPTVRLHAALGLAHNHDAEAVQVLIDLLAELPRAEQKLAEDYLTNLAGEWAVKVPQGDEAMPPKVRRAVWAAWWQSTTGANLLDEFRKRTLTDSDREKVLGLIRNLGAADLANREKASASLLALGPAAAPLLRQTAQVGDAQVRLYTQKCLESIEKDGSTALPAAAIRLIALRKPAGAAEALLDYLPFAENDAITEELREALAAVAYPDGKPAPILVKALRDKNAARRAAAAEALCQSGKPDSLEPVRKLLLDTDPVVRLRAALALAEVRDKSAIPVLIALLGELPSEGAGKAEDFLYRLAGAKAPAYPKGTDQAARNKWRDEWAGWWRQNGATLDLTNMERPRKILGFTLVLEQFNNLKRSGRVLELDGAGKVLWQIDGLRHPADAQYLSGGRVLIAEQDRSQVTERDSKGAILWKKQIDQPFRCQRLPSGNTFIATRNQLLEVDRGGKETVLYRAPQGNIAAATQRDDGGVILATYQGQYIRLDPGGKELKSKQISFISVAPHLVEFLPDDHFLVANPNANKVAEYNLDGKVLWEAKIDMPGHLSRLPNGHVLVISQSNRIVELNRAGQRIKELKGDMIPTRAWRR